ncbi:SDR family NAD(P)-dependent oxidoreductase [Piscinibacter sp.]|jgi:gluconate 5-dehydrogenase|uniref:SDR family NAD(P)-dependent oxidoreductase n=1 Tax=Piscinibacter sp. TaxID=1903157 RepID=UPI002DFD3245|nr:glucose 1-dehydrogenase [Burkholderiaceae bacterium]
MNVFSLEGRVALVSGASRGLGLAMARALASAGAHVVLAARDERRLAEVAEDIRRDGGRADIEAFDLLDETAVVAAVPRIVARHGRLDILLNNAGICLWSGLMESTLDVWRRTIDTNLTAVYLLAREAARPMIAQRSGRIINIGSYVSVIGRERLTAYVASKHGLAGLTKSLAGELGRHNITCNGIAPGFFQTEMAAPILNDPARAKIFTDAIAMGRWGRPEELAGAAVFLASEAASYVNGHMLHVDGGVAEVLSLPVAVAS